MRTTALALLIVTVACRGKAEETATVETSTPSTTDPSTTAPGLATDSTWFQDVRPVVYEKCAQCHNPDGIGTGDFTTYEGAYASRDAIAAWLGGGLMPLATADPECRPYQGADRMFLGDAERELLIEWATGGAPEGDEASAVDVELYDGHIEDTNISLPMPVAYTLEGPAGTNEYFCTIPENTFGFEYVEAIDVELGDPKVVHHMCLFADLGGNAGSGYGVDPETAASEGFSCGNPIIENDWVPLHCWAPGMDPVVFPEGVGMAVYPSPFLQLVIQMHYFNEDGQPHTDQSSYKFRTTDAVEREVWMDVMGSESLYIPAEATDHKESSWYSNTYGEDLEILGAFPHMHKLGTSYASAVVDGGEETCMVEGPYDFDHQATYMFDDPVPWPMGSQVSFDCVYDNSSSNPDNPSDPPQDVYYGEATTDEMCYLLFYAAEL